ncbi:MAG: hypothetical protein ACI9KS_002594 [Sulfitobacter sp.]|jgi:hypothetical protein
MFNYLILNYYGYNDHAPHEALLMLHVNIEHSLGTPNPLHPLANRPILAFA